MANTKRRTQQCIAAFAVTVLAMGGLCGFMIVDLSTDRYLPEERGPLFLVTRVSAEEVRFSALGQGYRIDSGEADGIKETVWAYRGMLPRSALLMGNLVARGYGALWEYVGGQQPEPW